MTYRALPATTMMAPLPVVMVTLQGADDGKPNILTAAWTGIVNTHPPMLSLSIRPSRYSYELIKAYPQFVVNLVDRAHARACDFCGVRSGREVDKWEATGLQMQEVPDSTIPGIAGCPVHIHCTVSSSQDLGSHTLFLAEIQSVQVRDDLFDPDGSLHLERAGLVCYNHGVYQQLGEVVGYFGSSVSRKDVFQRRMAQYKAVKHR